MSWVTATRLGLPEMVGPPVMAFPIRFAGDLPAPLVLALAAASVVAVLWLYSRETASLRAPYQWLLPALRASAVALAVLILAGPVWHRREVVGTLGRVVFALDTSRSMSLSDSQAQAASENRLQRAASWLLGDATRPGWLEAIAQTHEIDVITFDQGQPVSVWSSDGGRRPPEAFELSAEGAATELSRPLAAVLSTLNLDAASDADSTGETGSGQAVDSIRRSAVVLMTDGRDTAAAQRTTKDATTLAQRLADAGTAVNTLGMGSVDDPPDLSVAEVIRPETVALEGKLAGAVVVNRYGGNGDPVSLRIEADGQTVWQKTVDLPRAGQRRVPFELDVAELVESVHGGAARGIDRNKHVLRLAARVESGGVDFSAENNVSEFRVAASTRNRRLLIVDSSSRWETRYLKNLFVRDPAWETDLVLFGPGTSSPELPRGDDRGEFPATAKRMNQYDAVLLGEIDAEQLTVEDRGRLARFVAGGGGLIIVDGRFGRMRALSLTEFGEVMPVRYFSSGPVAVPDHLEATATGLEQPALRLVDQTEQLDAIWRQLPPPKWAANVELTEGAEAWGRAVLDDGSRLPWLATRMYGAGRVFYFGSDQTWRWRYKVADRFHARFWNQLVVAAMEPPYSASDQFVSIGTDRVEYEPGQTISVRARLRDVRGNPVSEATVDAVVTRDDQVVATIPMGVDNANRGTYAGNVPPLPAGEYAIRIRASGFDESALVASTPIWVVDDRRAEMARMSLDEAALRQLATAGGGAYVHESDASALLELLKPLSSGTVVETDTVLWQSYYWFWAIIALLAAEWWCRKRAGLV